MAVLVLTTSLLLSATLSSLSAGVWGVGREPALPGQTSPASVRAVPPAVGSWTAQSVPGGVGDHLGRAGLLVSVSCPKPEKCVALGEFGAGHDDTDGLLARLSGSSWSVATAPMTGLRPRAATSGQDFVPAAVDCASTTTCIAVGSYSSEAGGLQGAIETEQGRAWSARTAPLAGLSPPPAPQPHVLFSTLQCPTVSYCVAAGSYDGNDGQAHQFLEVLSGGRWRAQPVPVAGLAPSPAPGGASQLRLEGLSCWGAGGCAAVGSYQDTDGQTVGFSALASGGRWVAVPLGTGGLQPPAGAVPDVGLSGVQCPAVGTCFAVGTYRDGTGEVEGLWESLAAGRWSASTLPINGLAPGPAGVVALSPSRLACPTLSFCAVVGTYHDLYGFIQGFAETGRVGAWDVSTLPVYALTPLLNPRDVFAVDAVQCPAAGRCTVTGFYGGQANQTNGLIEQLAQGAWTGTTAPVQGLVPAAQAFPGVELDSSSCTASGFCVAVGSYSGPSGAVRPLAEVFSP